MANVTKQASTRFSIVKPSKGQSAVEKASYISRSILVSEFDGQTYRPKYHEDLVHSEITLPSNAPKEYADRATLWNSVELSEKGQKSQLARMLKASLPNEWSYELAEEVVRDYVQRNFVDKGMCADWAIHDSENDKGQRNLHIHVLLTMRPLTENGEWGAKTKKVYVLDENGERVPLIDKKTGQQKVDNRNRKQWKCQTVESTGWNSRENAKMWRKDLADTINATNEQLGIALHWEHRSFKEQGIDREPTIHIGAVANALERKGIQTERGQKLSRLKELSKMYALFAPIQATYKESQSLKGLAKMRYDKEHTDSLSKYPELRERMQSLLQNGEKVTPKQWNAEIQSLQSEYDSIGKEKTKTVTELAYAEVISYNRKNLARELQNESRQHNRQQNKTKRREEEI